MKARYTIVLGFCVAVVLAGVTPSSAQLSPGAWEEQVSARGFSPDRVFASADIDHVNLFNGSLAITIPIGQSYRVGGNLSYGFTLVYNSSVWDIEDTEEPTDPTQWPVRSATSNAGLGWSLTLGMLFPPGFEVPSHKLYWTYVSPDGNRNLLYDDLHDCVSPEVCQDGDPNAFYTRNGTYMRMKVVEGGVAREIEKADGTIHRFENYDTSGGDDWRLTEIRDRFGHNVVVEYPNGHTWTVTDSVGRTQTVELGAQDGAHAEFGRVVEKVELTAFAGETATYTFNYEVAQVERCYRFKITEPPPRMDPLLVGIQMPGGLSYSMDDGGHRYQTTCDSPELLPGALTGIRLPTLGEIEWDWGYFALPAETKSGFLLSPGVIERRTIVSGGVVDGTWKYANELEGVHFPPLGPEHLETRTYLRFPDGHCTKQYYSAHAGAGWQFGLPMSFLEGPQSPPASESGGDAPETARNYYRSKEIWFGATATDPDPPFGEPAFLCIDEQGQPPDDGGQPLRTELVEFDHSSSGGNPDGNRRLTQSLTIFHDDAEHFIETWFEDPDGLGHFRRAFEGRLTQDSGTRFPRETVVAYNPLRGTLGSDFQMLPSTEPWIIHKFDERQVFDHTRTHWESEERCYDLDGFLLGRRQRRDDPANPGPNDVVTFYERGGPIGGPTDGEVVGEHYYGGDVEPLDQGFNLCGSPFGEPPEGAQYLIRHAYDNGVRSYSAFLDEQGGQFLRTLFLGIDQSTGLATWSEDASNLRTEFEYDRLGRLTLMNPITPPAGPENDARTVIVYTPAQTSPSLRLARVRVKRTPNDGSATHLKWQRYDYDPLGRLAAEYLKLPDGSRILRATDYNGSGWKTSVSQWHADGTGDANPTLFLDYDTFGRPRTIRPPDGNDHDVRFTYRGVRVVERTVSVGTGDGVETDSTTTEWYDRFGRLVSIAEPSHPTGRDVIWDYKYDNAGRLLEVQNREYTNVPQLSWFIYDRVGNLTREVHDEIENNGRLDYGEFDALGNPGIWKRHELSDGPKFGLWLDYDRAGRVIRAWEGTEPKEEARIWRELEYSEDNGAGGLNRRKGKLWKATRYNYSHSSDPVGIAVTERYGYKGTGGRVANRKTFLDGAETPQFDLFMTWNGLGQLESQTYPRCQGPDCVFPLAAPPDRTVTHTYSQGFLTSIPGYLSSVTYHPNQMLHQVAHVNTVTETWHADPHGLRRPGEIHYGVGDLGTGAYAYDGAGNITATGDDEYDYDLVSRIASARLDNGALTRDYEYDDTGRGYLTKMGRYTFLDSPPHLSNVYHDGDILAVAYHNFRGQIGEIADFTQAHQPREVLYWDMTGMLTHTWSEDEPNHRRRYLYTADDERIATIDLVTGKYTWTLRGLDNKVLRTMVQDPDPVNPNWIWLRDYFYRQGVPIQWRGPFLQEVDGAQNHLHTDHLGTVRLATTSQGTVASTYDYWPFGQEANTPNDPSLVLRYTGHERDFGELNFFGDLDYMHARVFSPLAGRFLSIDPINSGDPKRPQSWLKYTYALNNPLKYVDPNGRFVQLATTQPTPLAYRIAVIQSIRRPSVRKRLGSLAARTDVTVTLGSKRLNSPERIRAFRAGTKGTEDLDTGQTGASKLSIDHGPFVFLVSSFVDMAAVLTSHSDRSGVTSLGHEFFHAEGGANGLNEDQLRAQDLGGDGPAYKAGAKAGAEEPDISYEDAEWMLDMWLGWTEEMRNGPE